MCSHRAGSARTGDTNLAIFGRSVLFVPAQTPDDATDLQRNTRRELAPWVRQYWWALLIVGVILVVIGTLTERDLMTIGGPFVLGLLCLVAGLGGGLQRYRSRRR